MPPATRVQHSCVPKCSWAAAGLTCAEPGLTARRSQRLLVELASIQIAVTPIAPYEGAEYTTVRL